MDDENIFYFFDLLELRVQLDEMTVLNRISDYVGVHSSKQASSI